MKKIDVFEMHGKAWILVKHGKSSHVPNGLAGAVVCWSDRETGKRSRFFGKGNGKSLVSGKAINFKGNLAW